MKLLGPLGSAMGRSRTAKTHTAQWLMRAFKELLCWIVVGLCSIGSQKNKVRIYTLKLH